MPRHFRTLLLLMGCLFLAASVQAQFLNLSFASLPSAQGWDLVATVPENSAFSVAGNSLFQKTVGLGGSAYAYYNYAKPDLDLTKPFTYIFRVRVTSDEGSYPVAGFMCGIQNGTKSFAFSIENNRVFDWKQINYIVDTSVFHTYRFDGDFSTGNCNLFIDGKYIGSSQTNSYVGPKAIFFGDGTPTGGNANAEITQLAFFNTNPANAQDLIVSEYFNNRAFAFAPDGTAKGLFCSSSGTSRFYAIAFDANSYLYASGAQSNNIRRFSPTGVDLGDFVTVSSPACIAFDHAGNLYVSSYGSRGIRRFSSTGADLGVFATLPGTGGGIAFDANGYLYAASHSSSSGFSAADVYRISPTGATQSVFASGFLGVFGLAFDVAGNLYVASRGHNNIHRFSPTGVDMGIFASTGLNDPLGLAFDSNGFLYVANFALPEYGTSNVRWFSPEGIDLGDFATNVRGPSGIAFRPLSAGKALTRVLARSDSNTPYAGKTGTSVLLKGTLLSRTGNTGLGGKTLTFKINGQLVGTAVTSTAGSIRVRASIPFKTLAGIYPVLVQFAGDDQYFASAGANTLTVTADTYFFQTPNRSAGPGQQVPLTCRLRQFGNNLNLQGKTITYSIGGTTIGTAVTDANGLATLNYKIPTNTPLGDIPVTVAFAGDTLYSPVTGTGNLSIKVNTYFFQTPVRTVLLGRSAALTCRLRQKGSNVDVPGVTIAYTLGGVAIGTALTDASGVATLTYPVPTTATLGDSPITITFAGNSQYNATTGTGKLTIQAGTLIASTPDRSGSRGGNVTLTARLVQSGTFAKLAGKTLTFSIGGTVIGSATTSTDGLATLTYAIPADAAVGTTKVAVSFAGDTFYAPSAGSINLTIK